MNAFNRFTAAFKEHNTKLWGLRQVVEVQEESFEPNTAASGRFSRLIYELV